MQNKLKRLLVLTAGLTGVLTLASCGETYSETDFTYNSYISTKPSTWNVHTWETNDESYITSFTEIGFYDVALNDKKDGYVFVTEMASEMPYKVKIGEGTAGKDITTPEQMDELRNQYGYSNPEEGMIWDIKLNENAKWNSDGKAITAEDYVESMRRQLDPAMVNFRADSFYASNLVIANAEKYYKSGRKTIEPLYNYLDTDTYKFKNTDDESSVAGKYYLNLGRYTPFVKTVFSNADETTTLYSVINQLMENFNDTAKLACQRIIDAVQYYGLHFVDHSRSDQKSDWDKAVSPSDVKADMMNYDILTNDFNTKEVFVRSSLTTTWSEHDKLTKYSEDQMSKDLNTFLRTYKNITNSNAYLSLLFGSIKNAEFSDFNKVGIKALDNYTIRLYLGKSISLLNLKFALSSNWLVRTDLYDKLIVRTSGLTSTAYATKDVKNYDSYGPYYLQSYEEGKSFFIAKNDKWYGWTDGEHVGQYQMTGIKTTVIEDHNTARGQFEKGLIDDFTLDANDMKDYGGSSRLTTTLESYTQKISFNSDLSKLQSRQKGNNIKTILANDNFRKGLSLAIDRNTFASQTTAGSAPFTGLLNSLYLTDVEIGEMYTSTNAAKSIYNNVYGKLGGDPYSDGYTESALAASSNGYNLQQAIFYVEKAIEEEIQANRLKSGDTIDIEFRVYDDQSTTTVAMRDFLSNAFKSAIDGAVSKYNEGKANKISIGFKLDTVKDEDYYNSAKAGNYDMIFSIWGGAAINPYGLMQVYCDPEFASCCEYGFKGKQDNINLDIDLNGDGNIDSSTETKSFYGWYTYINDTIKEPDLDGIDRNDPANEAIMTRYNQVHNERVNALAGLEAGILNRFEAIPVVARGSSSLTSFKVENGSSTYINLIGYGGIRHMKFNFNDKTWNEYVKSNGSDLSELYKL